MNDGPYSKGPLLRAIQFTVGLIGTSVSIASETAKGLSRTLQIAQVMNPFNLFKNSGKNNVANFEGHFYVFGKLGSGAFGTSFRLVNATADAKTPCLLVKLLDDLDAFEDEFDRVTHVAKTYQSTLRYTSLLERQPTKEDILLAAIDNSEALVNGAGVLFNFERAVYMRTGLDTCDFHARSLGDIRRNYPRVLRLALTLLATNLEYMNNDEFHNDIKDNNVVLLRTDSNSADEVLLIDYGGFSKRGKCKDTIITSSFAFYDDQHRSVGMHHIAYKNLHRFLKNPIQRIVANLPKVMVQGELVNDLRRFHATLQNAPDNLRYCYMRKMNVFAIALTLHLSIDKHIPVNDAEGRIFITSIINELLGSCGESYQTDVDRNVDKAMTLDGMRNALVRVLDMSVRNGGAPDRELKKWATELITGEVFGGRDVGLESRSFPSSMAQTFVKAPGTVPLDDFDDLVMESDGSRDVTTRMGPDGSLTIVKAFDYDETVREGDLACAVILEDEAEGGGGRARAARTARAARAGPRTARGRALRLGLGALLAAVCAAGSLLAA
jgi:hypothetical protein